MTFNVTVTSMKVMGLTILKLLFIGFELQEYCDLDLWWINLKIIRGHLFYYLWPTSIPSLKILGQFVLKFLIGQDFDLQCYCDLYLWHRNIKINIGHLLIMTNLHINLEDPRATRLWHSMPLWPWPLNV